jgi:hypothetical protein
MSINNPADGCGGCVFVIIVVALVCAFVAHWNEPSVKKRREAASVVAQNERAEQQTRLELEKELRNFAEEQAPELQNVIDNFEKAVAAEKNKILEYQNKMARFSNVPEIELEKQKKFISEGETAIRDLCERRENLLKERIELYWLFLQNDLKPEQRKEIDRKFAIARQTAEKASKLLRNAQDKLKETQ